MGACVVAEFIPRGETVDDSTVKATVERMIESARYDFGNRGYSGTIAEANGVSLELSLFYNPEDFDFVDKVAEKWGPAVVVRGLQDGAEGFFVCGVYSC